MRGPNLTSGKGNRRGKPQEIDGDTPAPGTPEFTKLILDSIHARRIGLDDEDCQLAVQSLGNMMNLMRSTITNDFNISLSLFLSICMSAGLSKEQVIEAVTDGYDPMKEAFDAKEAASNG